MTTGERGEQLATDYLKRQGYSILARNWRCKRGEIDIIAQSSTGDLAFVEVRTRHATNTERAFESISPPKQKRLIAATRLYLNTVITGPKPNWRIDVIAVALRRGMTPIIEHVEDALDW